MNNKMIGHCENCDQDYCQECTEGTEEWQRFCSESCEKEWAEENSAEVSE